MSEYWVSQAKKHCDFCKCWIADNKPSRDFHEGGKKHKENVKRKIDEVRKKCEKDGRKEEEMKESIREMNEAAMKAFKKDLISSAALRAQYLPPKEPPAEYGPAPKPESHVDTEEEDTKSDQSKSSNRGDESEEDVVGRWQMSVSEQGYPYYWNDTTSEVSWVAPVGYLKQEGIPPEDYHKYRSVDEDEESGAKQSKKEKKIERKKKREAKFKDNTEETGIKKPKTEPVPPIPSPDPEPLNILPQDIPLPGEIPLPPYPSKREENTLNDETELKEKDDSDDEDDRKEERSGQKRPKSHASYGTWENVQTNGPTEIDLGLPAVYKKEELATSNIPVYEPKMKFREKTVSSLGSGPVFFKKPKKKITAAQFLKKREDS